MFIEDEVDFDICLPRVGRDKETKWKIVRRPSADTAHGYWSRNEFCLNVGAIQAALIIQMGRRTSR